MKKIMIVAAAALWGTVAFSVESGNIVGYSQTALRFGMKSAGACFVPTAGATIDLQSIKVAGYNAEDGYAEGDIAVQTLTPGGATIKTYTWYDITADPEDPDTFDMYGWYEDGEVDPAELTIAPGEGLAAFGPSTAFAIQSAGQVPTNDIAVALRFGMKFVVNPTPVTISLNGTAKNNWAGIYVTGYNAEDGYAEGDIAVQTLTPGGATIKTYTWYDITADPEDPDTFDMYGWYEDGEDAPAELTIAPGDGLAAFGPSTAFSVVFPGVSL